MASTGCCYLVVQLLLTLLIAHASGLENASVALESDLRSDSASRYWVQRPGSRSLEVTSSLREVCKAEGLDEDKLMKVAMGALPALDGWRCGELKSYDPTAKAAAEAAAPGGLAQQQEPVDQVTAVVGIVKMGLSYAMLNLLKPLQNHPQYGDGLRVAYGLYVMVYWLLEQWLAAAIKKANDTSVVAVANKQSMADMRSGAIKTYKNTTATEYDTQQLSNMRSKVFMNVALVAVIESGVLNPLIGRFMKLGQGQSPGRGMMVFQTVGGLVDVSMNPIARLHLHPARLASKLGGRPSRPYRLN